MNFPVDGVGDGERWTTHTIPDDAEGAVIVGYVGSERGWLRLQSVLLRAGYEIFENEGEL